MRDDPFVYFDFVPAFGVLNGAIQIELTARVMKDVSGKVETEIVPVGHLRCSPSAAADLVQAINGALQMLQDQAAHPGNAIN